MSTEQLSKLDGQELAETENEVVFRPEYGVENLEGGVRVRVYIPGVAKEEVKVLAKQQHLFVEGKRLSLEREGWERLNGRGENLKYRLQLVLREELDASSVEAAHEDGVLTLTILQKEEARQREIKVL